MKVETVNHVLKIIIICCFWYMSSSSNNIIGKAVLSDFPYPMTLTMVQLISVSIYSGILLRMWDVKKCDIKRSVYIKSIIPLSFGKFMSSVTMHLSILKMTVSYTHTVKATMPLFTVILTRVLLGEKHTKYVYLSLVPIVLGISLSTITEMSFDALGLTSALMSTMIFTLQNIYSKKCMKTTGIHQFHLLLVLARIACLYFLPVWLIFDVRLYFSDSTSLQRTSLLRLVTLLIIDGFINFLQQVFAFSMIALVSPLTYSVANATKRVVIIASSLLIFGNSVSTLNITGMVAAILGVLYYNKVKYDEDEAKGSKLPKTVHELDSKNLLLSSFDKDWNLNGLISHPSNGYTNVSLYSHDSSIQNGGSNTKFLSHRHPDNSSSQQYSTFNV